MKMDRYSKQTSLPLFGKQGQLLLANASVLVVGVGGLGIPVLQYLNAMGVGTLGLVDQDIIELSNLQRQLLFSEEDVGRSKTEVAFEKLGAQNSQTQINVHDTYITPSNAQSIVLDYDIVVDATDNFPARYLLSDICTIHKKPLVYGALHGFEGHLSVFNFEGGPTYRCLYPIMPEEQDIPNCNDHGVLGVIPGIIGNLQAMEVIKIITGIGEVTSGKLLLYNGLNQSMYAIKFNEKLNLTGDS
jgi:adenylyltransferase/sulfurtransferase